MEISRHAPFMGDWPIGYRRLAIGYSPPLRILPCRRPHSNPHQSLLPLIDRHHGGGERSARRFGPGGTGECSAGGALLPSDARSGGRTRRAVEREGSEWGEDYRCAGVLGGATAARNQCAQRPVGLAEQAAVWPQVREKRPTPTLGSDARGRRSGGWEQPRGERHTAGSERPRSACWPEATPARAATRCPRPQAAAPLASAGPDHASHFSGSRAHLCDLWPCGQLRPDLGLTPRE